MINVSLLKSRFDNWEKEKIQYIKQIVEESFNKEPYFQTVFYNGEMISLDSYIEWKNDSSLDTLGFEIKTHNKNINLKKILEETERGVGSKGINPTAALSRLSRTIIQEAKKIGFNKKEGKT